MMPRIGGVDEAGRGSVFGPMIIAGVTFLRSDLRILRQMGVKDSKLLAPKRRSLLSAQIHQLAEEIQIVLVSPSEIDKVVKRGIKYRRLNFLEAKKMASIIGRLTAEEVFVDAPDTNPSRYSQTIQRFLSRKVKLVCRHKEDRRNPIVGAASIVAKVKRDMEIEKLKKSFGDFGSGYPSDRITVQFLRNWIVERGEPPPFTRTSWKTLRRVTEEVTD